MLGTTLDDRFHILRELAQGGMGKTYVAEQLGLGRQVVVKTLKHDWAKRADVRERFRREASLAASISHPNVVQVYDFSVDDSAMPYLVMEFIEGQSLEQAMLDQGTMEPEQLVSIVLPVLSALEVLHAAGAIHRDIKPANIMLSEQGPKLIDFGLARIFDGADIARLTQTGQIIGTPGYLAPEQVTGMPIDPSTDLYAVAVVMYRALSGRFPFGSDNPAELIQAVVRSPPTPLQDVAPAVPEGLVTLIHQGLAKVAEQRPESAAAFAEALTGWRQAGYAPTLAARASHPPRASDQPPEPDPSGDGFAPKRVMLGALVLLLGTLAAIAAGGFVFYFLYRSATNAPSGSAGAQVDAGDTHFAQPPVPQLPPHVVIASDAALAGDGAELDAQGDEPEGATTEDPSAEAVRAPASHSATAVTRPLPEAASLDLLLIQINEGQATRRDVRRWFGSVRDRLIQCFEPIHVNATTRATLSFQDDGRLSSIAVPRGSTSCFQRLHGSQLRRGPAEVRCSLRWRPGGL